jgi:excisionase family DNA binding protein
MTAAVASKLMADPEKKRPAASPARRRMLKTREAAEYLGISVWTLRKLAHGGKLPFLQNGDGWATFDLRDLDAYVDRNKRFGAVGT